MRNFFKKVLKVIKDYGYVLNFVLQIFNLWDKLKLLKWSNILLIIWGYIWFLLDFFIFITHNLTFCVKLFQYKTNEYW